jgi:hypothetical protein
MESAKNGKYGVKDYTDVFITPQYKCFLKTPNYKPPNSGLVNVKVKTLTEEYEVNEVDYSKVLAENEYFYLKDNDERIKELYEQFKNLSNHRELLKNVGIMNAEAKLKEKLLKKLEGSNNNSGQSSEDFAKKFENVLSKDNTKFIAQLLKKIKGVEMSVGLDFSGNLNDAIMAPHEEMISKLETLTEGTPIKGVDKRLNSAYMIDDALMLTFVEGHEGDYAQYKAEFIEFKLSKNQETLEPHFLECSYDLSTISRIQNAKYYPEASLFVVAVVEPLKDEFVTINIYEMNIKDSKVLLEPRHKIETQSEFVEFTRVSGVEYVLYSNDNLESTENNKIHMVNLENTFNDPKNKPVTEVLKLDMPCYQFFDLKCNYVVAEGPLDELALIDLDAREVVAYYKEHKKSGYYGYLSATYSKSKNLLFMMHNNEEGAVINTFSVNHSDRKLEIQQDFKLSTFLKEAKVQSFASKFFTMQFNTVQNRLDILDDYQKNLLRFKFDDKRELVKDKNAVTIKHIVSHESTPTHYFTRVEGVLFFLHFYVYDNVLTGYKINDK